MRTSIRKVLRFQGVKLAVFLDDGFVIDNTYEICKVVSSKVKRDLGSAGFVLNDEKSIWEPRQVIVWLGLRWNSVEGCIHITDRRLRKIFEHIEAIRSNDCHVRKAINFIRWKDYFHRSRCRQC